MFSHRSISNRFGKISLHILSLLSLAFQSITVLSYFEEGDNGITEPIYAHVMAKMNNGLFIAGGLTSGTNEFSYNDEGYFLDLSSVTDETPKSDIDALQWTFFDLPSPRPTDHPTTYPTYEPTVEPTFMPSFDPTNEPSTHQPSYEPTIQPSSPCLFFHINDTNSSYYELCSKTSMAPSDMPSNIPSNMPSDNPSDMPTDIPSTVPSDGPSDIPTYVPSDIPSNNPSFMPSDIPSDNPTVMPSAAPSFNGSQAPSDMPTLEPSNIPSNIPTYEPSDIPTFVPSLTPSGSPVQPPTAAPSMAPTLMPSMAPTTPSSETFQQRVFYGQMSFTYEDRLYAYEEEEQTFLVLRSLAPYNVTKTSNYSDWHGNRLKIENICVTHSDSKQAAYVVGNYLNKTYIIQYDLETDEWYSYDYWTALEVEIQRPFCMYANSKVYLFGGYRPDIGIATREIVRFRFNKDKWLNLTDGQDETLEEGRYFGVSVWLDDYIFIMGGNYKERNHTFPTPSPTQIPTAVPTFNPSTAQPTSEPINYTLPTNSPSYEPTKEPTYFPSYQPTNDPTIIPSIEPTINPSNQPSFNPTITGISAPTGDPTGIPTDAPTQIPSEIPTVEPTMMPTLSPTFRFFEYSKQNTEVFKVSTEHLVGYGPDLTDAMILFAACWDEDASILYLSGGLLDDDVVTDTWSYLDLRNNSITDFLIIPTTEPTPMPTDPTCVEETFKEIDWPETVMYEYGQADCRHGYRGTFDSRYCDFYETWDNKIIYGCWPISWSEDWDSYDNNTWVIESGHSDTEFEDLLLDGELVLNIDLINGVTVGDADIISTFLNQPLPARFLITVSRFNSECNNFFIAWGKDYAKWAANSFRLAWDCDGGSFQLSNSTYLAYTVNCFQDSTSMEIVLSVHDDGYVTVDTNGDCGSLSIFINHDYQNDVNDSYLFLGTFEGKNKDYSAYDEIIARFDEIHFTQFYSEFNDYHSNVWDNNENYQLYSINNYGMFLSNECCDHLTANNSWYQFSPPYEVRVGLVNNAQVANTTYSEDFYLHMIFLGDYDNVNVKRLVEGKIDQDDPFVAIVWDSLVTEKRWIITEDSTKIKSTDDNQCDWSLVVNDTSTHEAIVIIDDNGILAVRDNICGITYSTHNLGADPGNFTLGIFYSDDIVTYFEETLNIDITDNSLNESVFVLFDYVEVLQLDKNEDFVTTNAPTNLPTQDPVPQPTFSFGFETTEEADIANLISYTNTMVICAIATIWRIIN